MIFWSIILHMTSIPSSGTKMNAKTFYMRCLEQTTAIVNQLEHADFNKPTPDNEWTVKDLLEHILYELAWAPDIVRGKTMAEVGTVHDHIVAHADFVAVWGDASKNAKKAIVASNVTGPAHLSFAVTTVEDYLWQAGTDQLIHGWDLAEAIGYAMQFENDLAQVAFDYTEPNQETMVSSGLFAKRVDVPEDVGIQVRLLALTGRSYNWRDV